MGKKRTRVPGQPRNLGKPGVTDPSAHHSQTLEDDVREQRDVQFASEKRQTERLKRRRMSTTPMGDADASQARKAKTDSASKPRSGRTQTREEGLQMWRKAATRRKSKTGEDETDDGQADTTALDGKTGAKIIEQARKQRAEIRREETGDDTKDQIQDVDDMLHSLSKPTAHDGDHDDDDDDDDDSRSVADTAREWQSTAGDADQDLEFLDGSKITEEEERALLLFSKQDERAAQTSGGADDAAVTGPRIMLADIILQKIQEKKEADERAAAIAADPEKAERDRKIAEVYGLVGNIMSKYRSGKVPKAFKIIPKVANWEELLFLTRPDEWSPAAVYVATRLLASNLSGQQVTPFYTDVLLPICMNDVTDNKKLNYHLYRALTKAVYKPDAFCKGILFPLCEDSGCTLRQATIIASVVTKVSIPMLHSAAALLYISQLDFSPTMCLVMTALIEKKYALPYRVVDGVVDAFVLMKKDDRPLPLVWHKCLLAFAQRYKAELTCVQKDRLKLLMRTHTHGGVTPEIRRELFSARNRGDMVDPDANTIAKNIANAAAMTD